MAAAVEFEVGPEESISFAAQNVADCYYQFRLSLDLQEYFGKLWADLQKYKKATGGTHGFESAANVEDKESYADDRLS